MTVASWYKKGTLRIHYFNRILRAVFLRFLLLLLLPLFKVQKQFSKPAAVAGKKILVIVIGGLGDCLLFDPLFRRLKEKWPDSQIDVVSGSFEQMWSLMPSVDGLFMVTPTKFKTPWSYLKLLRKIYLNQYDIAAEGIAFLPRRGIYPILTSLIFKASQAPVRIGRKGTGKFGRMRQRESGFIGRQEMKDRSDSEKKHTRNPYLTHELEIVPPELRTAHESAYIFDQLGLSFFRATEEPGLSGDPPNDGWACNTIRSQWATASDTVIGITLETTRRIKTWPIEKYSRIVKWGIEDGLKFVLLGLNADYAKQLSSKFSSTDLLDLTGRTDLGQMIAAIRQCNLFLSGDTGPSHIAQACRVPSIVLFGPSNEKEFGPVDHNLHTLVLPPGSLSCRPCVLGPCIQGKSCIETISAKQVYDIISDKTKTSGQRHSCFPPETRKSPQRVLCVI